MKKVVLMALAAFCLLLAGCESQENPAKGSMSGNFYTEFRADDAAEDGSYQITAKAHVEDALPLVYLQAQTETEIDMEFILTSNMGLFWLVYVQQDGTEQKLLGVAGRERALPATWNCSLAVGPEPGYLEFRTSQNAKLQFELLLNNTDGMDIAMRSPEEEDEWQEMQEGLAGLNPPLGGSSVGMRNFEKELETDEPELLLNVAVEQAGDFPVKAALWDLRGDVQLVYVQPDGVVQQLWDSREQDGAEQPQDWQSPWDYILPEYPADVLTIDLSIALLPGEGRLEFRTENGAEFKLNILFENIDMLGEPTAGI